MAVRTVRFRPLILDGSGDPAIARGSYLITPFNQTAYGDLGQLLTEPGLTVAISGAAVTKDLPVVEAGDHNCLVVTGFFGPNARAPFTPSSVEYVFVPAGGTVIDYEDLPRVLPSTLGPVPDAPESEWELRLADVEAILAGGVGSGGGAPSGGGPGGQIRPEDLFGITATGILLDKPLDAAAARTAIGAGTSNLAIGTSSTTAAQGDRAALKDTAQTINAVWTFATNPGFNDNAIPQAKVNGLGTTLSGFANATATTASLTALDVRIAVLEAIIANTFQIVVPVSGAFPARPATTRHLVFLSSAVTPTLDGSLAGGGGMVPNHDIWIRALP